MNKSFLKSLMFLFLIVSGISLVSAAAGLNVILANQNPDPVSPGNFVFVNIKVSNVGTDDISNADLMFVENENFKLAQGTEIKKELGAIPAYSSSESSSSYSIGKYKLLVNDNTPLGLNTVEFKVETNRGVFEYEFEILVQESNPTLSIENVEVNTIEAGEDGKLVLEIKNDNSVDLKDIVLKLDLENVDEKVINVLGGSNQQIISSIGAGETKKIEFDLTVSPDANAEPVLLPIKIDYEDSLGNDFTQDISASVKVYSEPVISFKLDSQEVYTIGQGKVTFAIANPGTSTVKGVQVEILSSDDYEIIEGDFNYIGNLNPDDFQTIQSQVYVKNDKSVTLRVKLTYSDSYNELKEEVVEVPLKIYSNEELKNFGIVKGGTASGGSGFGTLIFVLIVGVIAFFVGRRFGYKKGKSQRRN